METSNIISFYEKKKNVYRVIRSRVTRRCHFRLNDKVRTHM